jgi:citrate lyase beta subunit
MVPMASFRSLLFAPAVRPERFERALAAGADAVCIDLEDAVPPAAKATARSHAAEFLSKPRQNGPALGVRINGLDSPWWKEDMALAAQVDFLMVPKVASPDQLEQIGAMAPGVALWPLVETPDGLMHSWGIAAAKGVQGILFGAFDYATEVGCAMDWEPLLFARSQLAAACSRSRVDLLDSPSGDVRDFESLKASASRAKALGFTGRACIHPDQLDAVHEVFTPSEPEIEAALQVVAAFDASDGGASQLDGRLIELPVALAARRILTRAGR